MLKQYGRGGALPPGDLGPSGVSCPCSPIRIREQAAADEFCRGQHLVPLGRMHGSIHALECERARRQHLTERLDRLLGELEGDDRVGGAAAAEDRGARVRGVRARMRTVGTPPRDGSNPCQSAAVAKAGCDRRRATLAEAAQNDALCGRATLRNAV